MDFIDKKEQIINILENYLNNKINKKETIEKIKKFENDSDFKDKQLFKITFNEIINYIDEIPKKQIKQRILMMKDFLD